MCPARARTSPDAIVAAARALLAREGPAGVTMQAVGAAAGVRGPSLYKRFADRAALLRAVESAARADLGARLARQTADDPVQRLRGMATAYRAFAHEAPHVYALLFAPGEAAAEGVRERAAAAGPVLAVTRNLCGAEAALPAARLLTAFLHGWVSMELAGAFQLGGDVEAAFDFALTTLLSALPKRGAAPAPPVPPPPGPRAPNPPI
jgi:AcrR family transcriptional regulator